MLFSATMPGEIVALSRRYLTRPTHVRAETTEAENEAPRTPRSSSTAPPDGQDRDRWRGCSRPRAAGSPWSSARPSGPATKWSTSSSTGSWLRRPRPSTATSARASARRPCGRFRNGKIDVLVATDVAARGIDVDDVTHVVNYDCRQDEKAYVHRIGRTGRADRTGVAVTFVERDRDDPLEGHSTTPLGPRHPEPVTESYSSSPLPCSGSCNPRGHQGRAASRQQLAGRLGAEQIEDLGEKTIYPQHSGAG